MILITGGSGQLGGEIARRLRAFSMPFAAPSRDELLVTDERSIAAAFARYNPRIVINCAAYTAVDQAEQERDQAFAVNAAAPAVIAGLCRRNGAYLLHVSTDFVFGSIECTGAFQTVRPWAVTDPVSPVGVYAKSKAAGETAILNACASGACILRTSWLYAAGGVNFPATILRLAGDPERERLTVVDDQIGRPTWAGRAADFILAWVEAKVQMKAPDSLPTVIRHFSNSGAASWFDFACAVVDLAFERGLIARRIPVFPVTSKEFIRPAPRPSFSVLDLSESREVMDAPHWRADLGLFMDEMKQRSA